jgi:hypothetical protein
VTRRADGWLAAVAVQLQSDFPGWFITVRRYHGGPRLEGYRPGCPAGLVAVITADPAELRRELDADARQH